MNRNPCSGCGSQFCDGRCFDECEADFEPVEEVAAPRVKHTRSAESAADELRRARALIERGWAQGQFARDASGYPVAANSPAAVCWCAMGAMEVFESEENHLYPLLSKAIGDEMVGMWNDTFGRTQAEVLAAFDRAIELAEQSA